MIMLIETIAHTSAVWAFLKRLEGIEQWLVKSIMLCLTPMGAGM